MSSFIKIVYFLDKHHKYRGPTEWWNLVESGGIEGDWMVESGEILTEWWNLVESKQIVVKIPNIRY